MLRTAAAEVKWEDSAKFHITLKFLGKTEIQLIQSLAEELRNRYRAFSPFDIEFQTLGCFPSLTRPRIIWIGTAPSEELEALQVETEEACESLAFVKEDRAFHAHITLGRVKGNRNLHRLTEEVKSITFEPIQARCAEVHIMRSELHPSGSTYSLVKSIPLQS